MSPVSALPAIAIALLALGLAYFFDRFVTFKGAAPPKHLAPLQAATHASITSRNASIDGMRGLLALFVFLHHACIWYFSLSTGQWKIPPSYFYTHLGQSSVALFFMITAFLFSNKLLNASGKTGDANLNSTVFWQRLFVSRFMRLTPLYLLMLAAMLLLTAIVSDFQLRESWLVLLKNTGAWASFTIFGSPDLNGVTTTSRMIAGVNWTLPYEWVFYFSLPVLALLLTLLYTPFISLHQRVRSQQQGQQGRVATSWPPLVYVLFSTACLVGLYLAIFPWKPAPVYFYAFAGGVFAAVLLRMKWLVNQLSGTLGSIAALLCLGYVFRHFAGANNLPATAWLTLAFTIMASGNSLFGLLHSRAAQTLGDASYGIYLLHGLVLYTTFKLVLGTELTAKLSVMAYWGVVMLCTVLLIPLCIMAFRWIEAPAIKSAPRLSRWLQDRELSLTPRRAQAPI